MTWFAQIKAVPGGERALVCPVCGKVIGDNINEAALTLTCEWAVCSEECVRRCEKGDLSAFVRGD